MDKNKKTYSELHREINVTPLTQMLNYGYPSKEMGQLLKTGPIPFIGLYRNESVILYTNIDHWVKAGKMIVKRAKNDTHFFESLVKKSNKLRDQTIERLHQLGYSQIRTLPNKKLASIAEKLIYNVFMLSAWSQIGAIADHFHNIFSDLLVETVRKSNGLTKVKLPAGKIISILTISTEKTPLDIAKKELILLKDKIKRIPKNKDRLIASYLTRWFWLNYGHLGPGLSKKWVISEMKTTTLDKQKRFLKIKQRKISKKLRLTKQGYNLFKVARIFVYLKGMRVEICNGAYAFLNQVAKKIEVEIGIDKKYLMYLSVSEMMNYLRNGKLPSAFELKRRRNFSVWLPKDAFNTKIYVGAVAKTFLKNNTKDNKKDSILTEEIRGSIAFPGKVRGRVKIINKVSEIKKMNSGNIMVSLQTMPELLPAMKKAAAFVTDIGGIVSHAAIVSREMKVPCIVGTKIATKVFKDGDLVEVDATKGIVRIIK